MRENDFDSYFGDERAKNKALQDESVEAAKEQNGKSSLALIGVQDEYFDNTPFPVPEISLQEKERIKDEWIEKNKKFHAELLLCKKRLDNPGVKYRLGRCSKCKEWTEVGNSCCGEEYVRVD